MSALDKAIASVSIEQVWAGLGGGEIKHGRAKAWWRHGDGLNIAINSDKGAWFDHVSNAGGGIIDLIRTALGCGRREAVTWLLDFCGIEDDKQTPEQRKHRAIDAAYIRQCYEWRDAYCDMIMEFKRKLLHEYRSSLVWAKTFEGWGDSDSSIAEHAMADWLYKRVEYLDSLQDLFAKATPGQAKALYENVIRHMERAA